MTEADRLFAEFPNFIREHIFRLGWTELRPVQLAAARVLFDSEDNLLLSSATASGKTEAAFFPILSELLKQPPSAPSVTVLYIAPLKSLINDQFFRMQELLDGGHVPVFHWHGDVPSSQKERFLREPGGVLQITPESLESMLVNRWRDIPRLFGDLRYIVIDELHALIGSARGEQVLCQLSRLGARIGHHPRRVGLSATLGDLATAAAWLGAGSGRQTAAPGFSETGQSFRLGMEHFYIGDTSDKREDARAAGPVADDGTPSDAGYELLYRMVTPCRSLIFSNSREETEQVTAALRRVARERGEEDIFFIHHGSLSTSLREEAERRLKEEDRRTVVAATVTMELGIDIGRLERVVQMGAPLSVAGFLQRLGRSGRRGSPPEMCMLFREAPPPANASLPESLPWGLLRGIAIVELYRRERFIEPPTLRRMPLSLAFQQTLSLLMAEGELAPQALAERLLSLPPFAALLPEDYRELLVSMVENEYVALTEEGGCIVGLEGERLTGSFRFYAVFAESEEFTVRAGSEEIGSVSAAPPVGDCLALAGRVWEVEELDTSRRLIYVRAAKGEKAISWSGNTGEIHTRILEGMHTVLFEDTVYPYLGENAKHRLALARKTARASGMQASPLLSLGGDRFVLFPWLGTRAFHTTRRILRHYAKDLGIGEIRGEGGCYITFRGEGNTPERLLTHLSSLLAERPPKPSELVGEEMPCFDRYDKYIPAPLLRRAYAEDRLALDEVMQRFRRGR